MAKSPQMEMILDRMSKVMFGHSRTESMTKNVCVTCQEDATQFRDEQSRKEYGISGLCQRCQDKVFSI